MNSREGGRRLADTVVQIARNTPPLFVLKPKDPRRKIAKALVGLMKKSDEATVVSVRFLPCFLRLCECA